MKVFYLTKYGILVVAALLALSGCEQEGPAEQAGENIDEAVEEVQEEAQDAGEQAMDKVEEATDKLEEKADSATD
jgi:hyperosmotically inducible protein